jgi:hypothetical protein
LFDAAVVQILIAATIAITPSQISALCLVEEKSFAAQLGRVCFELLFWFGGSS